MSNNSLKNKSNQAVIPFHSTETALIKVTNDLLFSAGSHSVFNVPLDLSCVFDSRPSGANKMLYTTYAVLIPKTCKQTLMYKIGEIPL